MGSSASDFYQRQDLTSAQPRKDQYDSQYIWLDLRIGGQENKIYLDKFRAEFKVAGEGKVDSFKEYVKNYDNSRSKLRVICAASLPEDVYAFIQNSETIERALLFCGNKIRAGNLMRDYSKIAKACYSYVQVIKQVKSWEKEPFSSFHFYQPQEIQRLNRFNANLMSLTDSKNIVAKESEQNMSTYLYQFLPNDLALVSRFNDDLRKARASSESMASFIKDNLLSQYAKIFNEINYLLKVTSNPKKLAYLRRVINDLFACISDNYLKLQLPQSTFYTVLEINQQQSKRILKQDQYFINSFFLSAETIAPSEFLQLKDHQIRLFIKTPSKQAKSSYSNGFFYYSKKVMFNPGCYFKLQGYEEASRTLTVRLMDLTAQLQKGEEKQQGIYLNNQWLSKLQSKYDGQWLALLFSDPASADSYINLKIEAIGKEKDKERNAQEQSRFKWILYKQQWNLQTNKLSNIEAALQKLKPYDDASKVEFSLILCDLLWLLKKQTRLKVEIKNLVPSLTKNIGKQLTQRIRIYQICDKILGTGSNPTTIKSLLSQLNEIELSLQKQQCYELSAVYFLLLTVKIRCLSELGSFNEELGLIDKIMKVYQICAGRSSPQCTKLNKLKVEVISLKNREVNDKQAVRKAKLLSNCKVRIDDLREPTFDCVYPVNCSKINLALYS